MPRAERCMKHERPETRTVFVANKPCAALGEEAFVPEKYPDNRVISSKYTLLTFLPKNLFEQFRRLANFYFLVVGIIQLLIDTPVTPITSILPLIFVISVTAVKQGYEDWLRHKSDREVNNRRATVVEGGRLKDCKSMDIKVGDIVRVQVNDEFPCDLVMLSSNDPEGKCYITTANLDGETNLKTQVCVPETRKCQLDSDLESLQAVIECEQPVADLYRFVGRISILQNGEKMVRPLSLENILLRGARLRNTTYVYGCAIYTGQESKMALNSKFKKTKFSRIERRMNTFLVWFMLTLFLVSLMFTILKYWYTSTFTLPWYVPPGNDSLTTLVYQPIPHTKDKEGGVRNVVEDFLAFMVIFNYVVPISLYVTVEMQKFIGSLFFSWDLDMYDEKRDLRAQANTSDLNEELGQVEYLFTDKTGTLTENSMCFRLCSITGMVFEDINGSLCVCPRPGKRPEPVRELSEKMEEFFTVLVLCHTVHVNNLSGGDAAEGAATVYSSNGEDYDYQASSPDEKALVEACRRYGIIYHGVRDGCMEVTFKTEMRRYRVLHILDFTSARRCMSVIVQDENDDIWLLCKGAEVAIFEKTVGGDIDSAKSHVDRFAVLGLRTLAVHDAYCAVERDLFLLGVTAVEDKLQDQVPETITALRMAGIKVWVLTGDKEETAINISHSTGHFNSAMVELHMTQLDTSELCLEKLTAHSRTVTMADRGEEYALIVDGRTLKYALTDHREVFVLLCRKCIAVLCCRMSPIQKAQVVRVVKRSEGWPVTAAIGDGANDVSMIQEADVGIGIMGKEGRQAVQSSDYAFSRFGSLKKALLFHGHLYYIRLAVLVQYFFYKNVAMEIPQVLYQFFSAFSQQTVYDPFFLMFYNITFTALPILIYGIFEQHLQRDTLLQKPHLYLRISRNASLSWLKFLQWTVLGIWHGIVCFFGVFLLQSHDVFLQKDGKMFGLVTWGSVIHIAVVVVVNFKLVLHTYYWSWPVFASYAFCTVGNFGLSFLVSCVIWPDWVTDLNFYWVMVELFSCGMVWLVIFLLLVVALLPDILIRIATDIRNHRSVIRPLETSDSEEHPNSGYGSTPSRFVEHEHPETRIVFVENKPCAALEEEAFVPYKYPDNRIISSKYTLLTFLPKNLFEQFRRLANLYFLVIGAVQSLIDTPVTILTTALPLTFVISMTAVKQGYEDWLRHKSDREVNNRTAKIVEGGHLRECRSMDIKVGDIVHVKINQEFPCDLVMLSSNHPEGKCYVTTANLDGETNLKTQVCVPETRKCQCVSDLESLQAVVECEQPVTDLYHFVGRITILQNGEKMVRPLSVENILLRGATLRNTTFVYGCAIYTGQESKMALNSKFKKAKFSRIERRMNTYLICFIVTLFLFSSAFAILKFWYTSEFALLWYVPHKNDTVMVLGAVENFLGFMVLFYYIIPMSLYITVELQKIFGSLFFSLDLDMYDEKRELSAQANTSDVNEELGQVEYLFTDKTGTLTENSMCFRLCSITGMVFEDFNGSLCVCPRPGKHPELVYELSEKMEEFFTVLVLCHTVHVNNLSCGDAAEGAATVYSSNGEDYDYQASSPDEKALVEACRRYGIIYHGVCDGCMEVTFKTEMRRYRVLHVLDFTSVRRCMSVIVQDENDDIWLMCKGAEVAIFEKTVGGDIDSTKAHVDRFAVLGLRTLAVAHKKLTQDEYKEIDALLMEAKTCLEDRETKAICPHLFVVHDAYCAVERDLFLLGATAVEDKLQDQVPETITDLRMAGIKVWVLTGDKEETAITISHSTGHFNPAMVELHLTQLDSSEHCLERITSHIRTVTMGDGGEEYALIVDGQTLKYALADHTEVFLQLCHSCIGVLCCRMSPLQKAQVVQFIKQSKGRPVTAAIGDGANDVSMIQEADVGLGIMGKEGRQAALCSDYAFSKFGSVRKALLFHGHLFYVRLAIVVQYSFYKNIAMELPQVLYQFFSAFSQQTVYDPFFLMFYNLTFTSLPTLIYSLFEQHFQKDVLMQKPHLYSRITKNASLSWAKFVQWTVLGIWHGLVCFFGVFLLQNHDVFLKEDGKVS
ncbi:hypothetical protein BaRGS_00023920 [Batillaria attramentaria]|uniref:P-type phospholipid transporter n=1 Tax=Batillaria attramentaria TaxID=370345 RepID=A0ABD0KCX3_9CAEN